MGEWVGAFHNFADVCTCTPAGVHSTVNSSCRLLMSTSEGLIQVEAQSQWICLFFVGNAHEITGYVIAPIAVNCVGWNC